MMEDGGDDRSCFNCRQQVAARPPHLPNPRSQPHVALTLAARAVCVWGPCERQSLNLFDLEIMGCALRRAGEHECVLIAAHWQPSRMDAAAITKTWRPQGVRSLRVLVRFCTCASLRSPSVAPSCRLFQPRLVVCCFVRRLWRNQIM